MSLTSYRAAPPRVNGVFRVGLTISGRSSRLVPRDVRGSKHERGALGTPRCVDVLLSFRGLVLGRPGNDLLSRVLRHSTIGAEAFNGRVRDGIGFFSASLKSPDRRRTRASKRFVEGPALSNAGARSGLPSPKGSDPQRSSVSGLSSVFNGHGSQERSSRSSD